MDLRAPGNECSGSGSRCSGSGSGGPGSLQIGSDRVGYRRVTERPGATGVLPDDRACSQMTGCVVMCDV